MSVELQKTIEFGNRNYEVSLKQLSSSLPPLASTPFSIITNIGCGQYEFVHVTKSKYYYFSFRVGPNGTLSPILYAGMAHKENALKIINDTESYVPMKEMDLRHIELQLVGYISKQKIVCRYILCKHMRVDSI